MSVIQRTIALAFSLSFLGCASTDVTEAVRSAPIAQAKGSYGFMTPTGLVINRNKDTIISYEKYVGEDCAKHLKAMTGLLRKINDSQCNPSSYYNPQTAQICRQIAAKKQARAQKDQICLARQQEYQQQNLMMRAVPDGSSVEFAAQMVIVAQGRFNAETGKAAIKFNSTPGYEMPACFVLTNDAGQAVPIRDTSHSDRYFFSAKYFTEQSRLVNAATTQATLEKDLFALKADLSNTTSLLASNTAYKNGQCVKPAQRSLPTKPDGMDYDELQYQANGGCTDLIMRRFDGNEGLRAFTRLSWDDKIRDWRKWSSDYNNQASCTKNLISQVDTSILEVGCSLFFKKQLLPGCIQEAYKQCMSTAQSRCNGPRNRWHNRVAKIKAEPRELLASCVATKTKAISLQSQLQRLEQRLVNAKSSTIRARTNQSAAARIDLEDAYCSRIF